MELDSSQTQKPSGWIGTRHRQIGIIFFGLMICYFQRVNFSVGIVAMTNPTPGSSLPVINYSTYQIGILSGVFYGGYMMTGMPAGYMADKYGPIRLLGIAGGIVCGIFTILVPFGAIYWGFEAVCVLRICQGLGQGVFYPSTQAFLSKWAIPQEREQFSWVWSAFVYKSTMNLSYVHHKWKHGFACLWFGPAIMVFILLSISGCQLGTIIMMPLGGLIAAGPTEWPSIFYFSGAVAIIWGIFCLRFGADSPAKHRSISKQEKDYIEHNFKASSKKGKDMKIPYKDIITSIPVLALLTTQASDNWGFAVLITLTPTYLQGVYNFDIAQNGYLSALPYLVMFVATYVFSYLGTHLREKTSVNFNRKFWNSVAMYGSGAALIAMACTDLTPTGAIVLLMLTNGVGGAMFTGYLSNHLDLAPNYAGVLLGLTNALGNIPSIVSPTWTGHMVEDEHSMSQWQSVFLVTAIIKIVGNTVFIIFGSTQIQKWNEPPPKESTLNL